MQKQFTTEAEARAYAAALPDPNVVIFARAGSFWVLVRFYADFLRVDYKAHPECYAPSDQILFDGPPEQANIPPTTQPEDNASCIP